MTDGASVRPGDPVRVVMTKWGALPHWEFDACLLGSDEHGDWFGIPAGTPMSRPGMSFVSETDQVGLAPAAGTGGGGGWVATFHAPGYWVSTYVDMTTPPTWHGDALHAVDLDLDVLRLGSGDVFVDDEDEFAEHQRLYDYPPDVVALAEASRDWVHDAVLHERAPFDGTAERWLALVSATSAR